MPSARARAAPGADSGAEDGPATTPSGLCGVPVPTFVPTTVRTSPHRYGRLRNIVPGQRTSTDFGERLFGIYDLFEGTEQIQQLVISRAISGLHIR